MTSSAAEDLADFVLAASWEPLPENVRKEAVRAFVNWAGCTVGGARTEPMNAAVRGVSLMRVNGDVPLLGRTERFDPINAAMLNCIASCCQTFDDTHLPTITHPTGPVAAALLAIAATRKISGKQFLLALALGIEIECRVSNAIVGPGKTGSGGWFITGVTGGIGAATAAGLLLGLPRDQFVSAIGLATAQACGFRSTHGSMAITFVPGAAARNGLTAALLATAGYTASPGSIDGRNGLLEVLAPGSTKEDILAGLGTDYELLKVAYKPYPCGIVIHPAIDACLEIARARPLREAAISRVHLRVHNDAMRLTWRKLPKDELEAQVSLFHWTAAALLKGEAGIAQGEDQCVQDPDIRNLQDRIDVEVDPAVAPDEAYAQVTLNSGEAMTAHIAHATGSAMNPMTDQQLSEKFRILVEPVFGAASTTRLLNTLWDCSGVADIESILHLIQEDESPG